VALLVAAVLLVWALVLEAKEVEMGTDFIGSGSE